MIIPSYFKVEILLRDGLFTKVVARWYLINYTLLRGKYKLFNSK